MNASVAPTILIVPGLRDHVPEHWQTLLEQKLPNARLGAADGARQALLRRVGRRARPHARRDRGAGRPGRAQRRRDDHRALGATARPRRSTARCSRRRRTSNHRCPRAIRRRTCCAQNGWLPTPRARLPFPEHRRGQHQRSARAATIASPSWLRRGAAASSTSVPSATSIRRRATANGRGPWNSFASLPGKGIVIVPTATTNGQGPLHAAVKMGRHP